MFHHVIQKPESRMDSWDRLRIFSGSKTEDHRLYRWVLQPTQAAYSQWWISP